MRALVFLLMSVAFGFSFSSCCDDLDYNRVDSLSVFLHENDSAYYDEPEDSALTTTDSLFMLVEMHTTYIASNTSWFINSATAHSCYYGSKGLKDRLALIAFQSDQPYNGVPSGESINAFVKGYGHNWDYATQTSTAITYELVEVINRLNESPYGQKLVVLKPAEPVYRRIKMTMVFASGRYLVYESPVLKWQ